MQSLAETQKEFTRAVLNGLPARDMAIAPGRISSSLALQVHRNTVLGGLSAALRLTFKTVHELVGEDFFNQTARVFIEVLPPRMAWLSAYGDEFPGFLESYAPVAELAYLADVARLDLALDRIMLHSEMRKSFALSPSVSLDLPRHLCVLKLHSPADLIRDGLEARDDAALAAIDLLPAPRSLVIWRTGRRASLRVVDATAGLFLDCLTRGASVGDAFAAVTTETTAEAAMQSIQRDVFAATFSRIISENQDRKP